MHPIPHSNGLLLLTLMVPPKRELIKYKSPPTIIPTPKIKLESKPAWSFPLGLVRSQTLYAGMYRWQLTT